MIIRSQNKEVLIAAAAIRIIASKKSAEIYAGSVDGLGGQSFVIGDYPTKEIAIKELDDIMQFFVENPSGIYQMK
ncbi:MAG: hypothetical protein LBE55_05050 [Clostridiales bacterium]|jgi:hypothetical protein|nr:hypothetical protein [Clostridiales bacterium]